MKTFKINEVGSIISGGTPSTSKIELWDGEVIWITPKDLSKNNSRYIYNGQRNISKLGLDKSSAKILPSGAVLLSSRAPIGYLAISGTELATNQGFKSIICDKNIIIPLYLYYLLSTKIHDLISISSGSTFLELSKNALENFEINIHSIEEQQHIVDTIGSIDDLIELIEQENKKIKIYINKKYLRLTNRKNKIKIGELSLIQIVKSGINKFDSNKIYLDTASVDGDNIISNDYIISYDKRPSRANMQPIPNSIWFAKLKDSPKYIFIKDYMSDLLNKYIFSTGFLGIQVENEFIANYLYAVITSKEFDENKNRLSIGATMQGINNESFKEILIPKNTLEEMISFGKNIDKLINQIQINNCKISKLKELKTMYLKKFFG